MTGKQKRAVFGDAVHRPLKSKAHSKKLLDEIDKFRRDSLARKYYAPFNVNSKNFMDIPEETDEWCHLFAGFVDNLTELTAKGEHAEAVAGFAMLYEVLEAMDDGNEIIFAEEAGAWMIPADEKKWLKCYLTSLAATATPEGFVAAAIPILKRDSYNSFVGKTYAAALAVATSEQRALLQAEIKRQKVRSR